MDQQLLWIVAVIGAGTLLGTFFKMKGGFGPINLRAVGIVLIAVLASLLAIAKLDNMTAAMGILGAIAGYLFGAEAKEASSAGATTGVDASGAQVGDNATFAGRDVINTVNKIERMLGDLSGRTNVTIKNMEQLNEKFSQVPLVQRKTEHFPWEPVDRAFLANLKTLSRSGEVNWTERWIELCLTQPDCIAEIRRKTTSRTETGWKPRVINFDNHGEGILVTIEFEREFPFALVTE